MGNVMSFADMEYLVFTGQMVAKAAITASPEVAGMGQYASLIKHKGVEFSGLAHNEVMDTEEMLAWADTTPPAPPPPSAATETVFVEQVQFTGGPVQVSATASNPQYVTDFMRLWELRRNGALWTTRSTIGQAWVSVDGSSLANGTEVTARVRYVSGGIEGTPSGWSAPIYYRA